MPTKSLLINYVGYPNEPFNLMPDNGLASLAACLMEKGHETTVFDLASVDIVARLFPFDHFHEYRDVREKLMGSFRAGDKPSSSCLGSFYDIESKIDQYQDMKIREIAKEISGCVKDKKIDFVGMKLWTGAGFYGSMIIAARIKRENPDVLVFGGGPHVDWFGERIFRATDVFDVLAYGEGEKTITMLADYAESKNGLEHIPNIIYKRDGFFVTNPAEMIENLDALPLPVYDADVYPAMKGDRKLKIILFDESRGCPNSCNFCVHPQKSGRKRRIRDANKVVSDLETMYNKYGFTAFRFSGSNPPGFALRKIAEAVIERRLAIKYAAYAHVKGFSGSDFEALKQSGCVTLSFGAESGSQEILDKSINKRISVDEMRRALIGCKSAGIKVTTSIIMPAPNETENTKTETFEFLRDVRPDSTLVFFPMLIPGTEWHKQKEKFGFSVMNEDKLFDNVMTFRVNHLAPPFLWRKLDDYSLNQKDFHDLGKETAEFTARLENIGLTTQLFDQTLLIAEYAGMEAKVFSKLVHTCLSEGDHASLRTIVAETNARILNYKT
jgi:radical SAM superfamily enzyme YgiQ (UPF0313 family)